jgi:hypothetical protein
MILGMFTGILTVAEATDLGLEMTGDISLLDRVLPQPAAAT